MNKLVSSVAECFKCGYSCHQYRVKWRTAVYRSVADGGDEVVADSLHLEERLLRVVDGRRLRHLRPVRIHRNNLHKRNTLERTLSISLRSPDTNKPFFRERRQI